MKKLFYLFFLLSFVFCSEQSKKKSIPLDIAELNDTTLFYGFTGFRGNPYQEFSQKSNEVEKLGLNQPVYITLSFENKIDSIALIWDKGSSIVHVIEQHDNVDRIIAKVSMSKTIKNNLLGTTKLHLANKNSTDKTEIYDVILEVKILPHINLMMYRLINAHIGKIKIKNKTYNIGVFKDTPGSFSDLSSVKCVVDFNQDSIFMLNNKFGIKGKFNAMESFNATQPFKIDGNSYEVGSISQSGDLITIVPSLINTFFFAGFQSPSFSFTTLQGDSVNINNLKGKLVVVNIWANWCTSCFYEMPRLNQLYGKYKNEDIAFIALTSSTKSEVSQIREKHKFDYTIGLISNEVEEKYFSNNVYPQHYIINKEGAVIFNIYGATTRNIEMLDKIIEIYK